VNEKRLLDTLDRFELPYEFYTHIPFIGKLVFETKEKNVMMFGSINSSHLAKPYGWTPGPFYNENHDYTVYSKHYKENMLNADSIVQKITDPITIEDEFFARPVGDTKTFFGKIYCKETWDEALTLKIHNSKNIDTGEDRFDYEELIQIASLKEIYQEVRCFIVKGKVIIASTYKMGGSAYFLEYFDEDILEFANNMIDLYQLADAFVMDICRTEKGLRIVECGCLNACGFYDINMQKLIEAIELNFNNENI
jgi:hypothetical protein